MIMDVNELQFDENNVPTILTKSQKEVRAAAEADFETFIRLVAPYQLIGGVHAELCSWMSRSESSDHKLVLLPRDHGKSRYAAFYVCWRITKRPDIRVLYLSSTSNLAEKQLSFMKELMLSKTYRRYWPEMINEAEGKRLKWTGSEISVDHWKRKEEGIRDPTIFTGGLTTTLTGLHCDLAVLDDVVVYENAYTASGRSQVQSQFSLLSSIEGTDAEELVVGTRYHPDDLYGHMQSMESEVYDKKGNITQSKNVYEIFQREVEDLGDGTGEFLWPRQQRDSDGKWFGFNSNVLAKKRAKYLDKTQFYAQYYNNPNDPEGVGLSRNTFQYYDRDFLKNTRGTWFYQGERLNVIASMDFSYSMSKKSDYTVIVVLGMTSDRTYYVLDIDRFKTDSIREYYERLAVMYSKWEFRKLVAEVNAAQQAIVRELKNSYLMPNGIMLSIIEEKPTRHEGTKEERMLSLLNPVYENMQVYHYRGGNCQVLEDELILQFPPHDDVKDCLSSAIKHAVPPSRNASNGDNESNVIPIHPRFGGVSHA